MISANQLPFANSANPVMSLVSIMNDLQLEMTGEIDISFRFLGYKIKNLAIILSFGHVTEFVVLHELSKDCF